MCYYHVRFADCSQKCESLCAWQKFHQMSISSVAPAAEASSVFFLKDVRSSTKYLVDTGACRSLLPKSHASSSSRCSNVRLRAANGSPIQTYGVLPKEITVSGKTYAWEFIVADVTLPSLALISSLTSTCWLMSIIAASSMPPPCPNPR